MSSEKPQAFVAFVFGVLVGAVFALLFAPKSGEELREEIIREIEAERQRASRELERIAGEARETLAETRGHLQASAEDAKEAVEGSV